MCARFSSQDVDDRKENVLAMSEIDIRGFRAFKSTMNIQIYEKYSSNIERLSRSLVFITFLLMFLHCSLNNFTHHLNVRPVIDKNEVLTSSELNSMIH